MKDAFENPVTTHFASTVAAIDAYGKSFLGYGPDLPLVIGAADRDPGCALVNAQAAIVHMALEAAEGHRAAEPYLARAQAAAPGASEHEQAVVAAARAWCLRDFDRVARLQHEIVRRWPSDIVTAKWGQYHCFNLGNPEGMLRLARMVEPVFAGEPYFHGMEAFALEQCHRLREAEEAGRRAVEIERADPWAHHALAHTLETLGRTGDGLVFLQEHADTWDDRGIFIREHNWWHVALFHIERDELSTALDIFDRRLWGEFPEFGQEQIGAISALWRLELRQADVGRRWEPVGAKVREREFEHLFPFHDLHYAFALARMGWGAEAEAFLASMRIHAGRVGPEMARAWRGVAVPAAQGLVAYAQGAFEAAFDALTPVIDRIQAVGGSHAQRDVFLETWVDAVRRTGRVDRAAAALADRAKGRPRIAAMLRRLEALGGGAPSA